MAVKPILRSQTTTREVPARTVEEEKWECTCGLEFDSHEFAQLHYGEHHAFDKFLSVRSSVFYLISSESDFECWKVYQRRSFGDYRPVTHNEWKGPGWYCSQSETYGRHISSVWYGEHSIVSAESVIRDWQVEATLLQEQIAHATFVMSMPKAEAKKETGPTGPLDSGGF